MTKVGVIASVLFWTLPVLFMNFWTASRVYAYFTQSLEWNQADFAGTVLAGDVNPAVREGFFVVMARLFDKTDIKYWTIRTHIALSAPMAVLAMLQLLPFVRKRNINLHRKMGYAYVALLIPFTLEQLYTCFIVGYSDLDWSTAFANFSSLVAMVVGTTMGIIKAKQHKVSAHRKWMLLNTAGLYVNPAQRFFWVLLSKANYMGPYSSYKDWTAKPLRHSEWITLAACYGTAMVYMFVLVKPAAKKKTT